MRFMPKMTLKNERQSELEKELDPMNYAKVFADDKYLTYKPK